MIYRLLAVGTIILTIAFSFTTSVLVHGGEPRLEISVERLNPGGVIDVRGVAFDYEESVTLYLERPGIVIQLGEVVADLEGVFLHIIVLPVDLPEGEYNIRAVADHHDILSPMLMVQGSAMLEGGGRGERDEDDSLLAPMPTFAPAVATVPVPSAPVEAAPGFGWNPRILALGVLMVIGIVLVLGLKRKNI